MFTRIVLCGVGGQGTILAAHILAEVAKRCGCDVKVSEIHGMAQRGGSVTTIITFGDKVMSMVAGIGEADILLSFDKLEAIRNVDQLKDGGMLICNDAVIQPAGVLTGVQALPANMDDAIWSVGGILVPAESAAIEAGSPKTVNIVMLGALAQSLEFPKDAWLDVIAGSVPPKTISMNEAAFESGYAFAEEHANQN